jgi:hypothetical protein
MIRKGLERKRLWPNRGAIITNHGNLIRLGGYLAEIRTEYFLTTIQERYRYAMLLCEISHTQRSEGKGKFVPVINYASSPEGLWRSEGIAPCIHRYWMHMGGKLYASAALTSEIDARSP